jgi:hypothetical protein
MSIFTPVPNNGKRVLCSICNKQVSLKLKDDHQQYHVLGDMALSPTQTLCKECNTPVSIKSYQIHLEGFHRMAKNKALLLKKKAELELTRRNGELPKLRVRGHVFFRHLIFFCIIWCKMVISIFY